MSIQIISIAAIVLLIVIFFLKKKANPYGPNVQDSSFLACINPFDNTIRNIYKSLSPENKGSFWSVVSNTSVAILTFWIGFTVQFFIFDSTKSEEYKLSHFQVVDKIKPIFDNMNDSCTQHIFQVFSKALCHKNNNNISPEQIIKYINNGEINNLEGGPIEFLIKFFIDKNEWDNLVHVGEKCIDASSSIAPYLESEKANILKNNNCKIIVGINVYKALKDSVPCDSNTFIDNTFNMLLAENAKGRIADNAGYKEISTLAYRYYNNILKLKSLKLESNKVYSKKDVSYLSSMVLLFSQLFAIPFVENTSLMKNEFASTSRNNNIFMYSFCILLACLMLGYFVFRIIIIKFFNRYALNPAENELSKRITKLEKIKTQLEDNLKKAEIDNTNLMTANRLLLKENQSLNKELDEIRSSTTND